MENIKIIQLSWNTTCIYFFRIAVVSKAFAKVDFWWDYRPYSKFFFLRKAKAIATWHKTCPHFDLGLQIQKPTRWFGTNDETTRKKKEKKRRTNSNRRLYTGTTGEKFNQLMKSKLMFHLPTPFVIYSVCRYVNVCVCVCVLCIDVIWCDVAMASTSSPCKKHWKTRRRKYENTKLGNDNDYVYIIWYNMDIYLHCLPYKL